MPVYSITEGQPWFDQNVPLDYKPTPVIPKPSSLDTWAAAFRTENSLSAGIDTLQHGTSNHEIDQSFDPLTDEYLGEKHKPWAKKFIRARNRDEADAIKSSIDRELEDRKTLDQAGFEGVLARMTAGLVDPISLVGMAVTPALVPGKFAASAAKAIGANAGFQAAQEGALQATTETRSWKESAINVAGAALISGILGGAAGRLSKAEFDDLATRTAKEVAGSEEEFHAFAQQRASMGAAAVKQTTLEQETLRSAFGLEKVSLSPGQRIANSPSIEARKLGQRLMPSALQTEKNVEGIATPHAAWTEIRRYDADEGALKNAVDDHFLSFRKAENNPVELADELERAGFRVERADVIANPTKYTKNVNYFKGLVTGAARNGDQSAFPQVAAVAKVNRNLTTKYESEAIDAGLFKAKPTTDGTAASYAHRVWDKAKIKADGENFRNLLIDWIGKDAKLLPGEANGIADNVINALLGSDSIKTADLLAVMPKAGPLHERTLMIPDNLVAKYLERDIEKIHQAYVRGVVPEIVLARNFGGKNLTDDVDRILTNYDELKNVKRQEFVAAGKPEAELNKVIAELEAAKKKDLDDIAFLRDGLLGNAGKVGEHEKVFARSAKGLRQVVTMAQLGGQTVSSLSDTMRPVMAHGLARYAKAVSALASNPELRHASRAELQSFGVALEVLQSSRFNQLADIADDFGHMNKAERGLDKMSQVFAKTTGMQHWNSGLKQISGLMTGDRILSHSPNWAALSKNDRALLANLGLDEASAARIAQQFAAHGEEMSGMKIANLKAWDDVAAKDAYELAVLKHVDIIINTPNPSELPKFMQTWWGKTLMQFKSFLFTTHTQTLLAGLQQRDFNTVFGAVGMVGMGAIVTAVKTELSGKEPPKNAADWLINGIDNSGVLSIPLEINNISSKFGGPSIRGGLRLAGIETENKRFVDRSPVASLGGPALGYLEKAAKAPGAAYDIASGAEPFDYQNTQKVVSLLPGQNLWAVRPYQLLFNFRETLDRSNAAHDKMFGPD